MKKLAITFSLMSISAFAVTMSGTIGDEKCGAKHEDASAKSMACAKKCVESGAAPVFISDGKVMKIANPDAVKEVVGQKVSVTGDVEGDTITIAKVTPESK